MPHYVVKEKDIQTWKHICKQYAKKVGAELLFVNSESFGLMYPNETFQHIYVDELEKMLSGETAQKGIK